ncbi:MAG: hypothetical protein IJG23_07425 [Clostridia bacterium]|nr:hypothetical protein [Clostridia bacterium]
MNAKDFIHIFFSGNFAKEHLYSHVSAGFPLPIRYGDALAVKLLLHPFHCNEQSIVFSAPAFEVIILYPSGQLMEYRVIKTACKAKETVIAKADILNYKNVYVRIYNALDELLDFYTEKHILTDVLFEEYYDIIKQLSAEIGFEDWYGGCENAYSDNRNQSC